MESLRENRRQLFIGIGISAVCLILIFLFIEPAAILQSLLEAQLSYLGLSALGVFFFMLIRAVRWRYMLNNQVPWSQVFHIQNIGYMFNMLLPLRLGDVARALLIGNVPPATLASGLSTMVVERVLDMMFIVTLLPFTLSAVEELPNIIRDAARFSGILAVSAIVILIVAANQRPLAGRITAFVLERIRFLETAVWVQRLLLSILTWLPIIFAYYVGMIAVNIEPTVAMAGFVVCAAALSIAAPSSPGQVGVFHGGVTFALVEVLGQPGGPSASFAFAYHAINLLSLTILGLIGLASTGATFSSVVDTTTRFMRRRS